MNSSKSVLSVPPPPFAPGAADLTVYIHFILISPVRRRRDAHWHASHRSLVITAYGTFGAVPAAAAAMHTKNGRTLQCRVPDGIRNRIVVPMPSWAHPSSPGNLSAVGGTTVESGSGVCGRLSHAIRATSVAADARKNTRLSASDAAAVWFWAALESHRREVRPQY